MKPKHTGHAEEKRRTPSSEELSLTRRLALEELVVSISLRFVGGGITDEALTLSLADVARVCGAQHAFLFFLDEQQKKWKPKEKSPFMFSHAWHAQPDRHAQQGLHAQQDLHAQQGLHVQPDRNTQLDPPATTAPVLPPAAVSWLKKK